MLAHIKITHFAIVKSLELDLTKGMTTITGETGAGKSIAIDALGLCLGDRAEASMVRQGEEKAEITVLFTLENNLNAKRWLEDNELYDGNECILRRVITKEGRSRGFINGSPVPAAQLKTLGHLLINIHGQHAHHELMKPEYQLNMLDQYAGHVSLLNKTRSRYQAWRQADNALRQMIKHSQQNEAQKQPIEYQIKELNELALGEEEFVQLEEDHTRLSNSGELVDCCQQAVSVLYESDEVNALQLLQYANNHIQQLGQLDPKLAPLSEMLNEAMIQVEEANHEIKNYLDNIDVDPEQIAFVEERFSRVMSMAKKHHVLAEELYEHHQQLLAEYDRLDCSDEKREQREQEVEELKQHFLEAAHKLTKSRQRYAKELNNKITESMQTLSMEKAVFDIQIESDAVSKISPLGIDTLCFKVSTNPGQPLHPIAKVASGGELSRISLAIQVITAQKVDTPSLIFDEVDVGISGPTAAVVGKMLRTLGESTQVLCVTHLPQVAGCGHNQLFVAKHTNSGKTETQMRALSTEERIEELARLLGGTQITDHTLANAKELLSAA